MKKLRPGIPLRKVHLGRASRTATRKRNISRANARIWKLRTRKG